MLLNDLAVVYKYAARFDDAEALYRRGLGIIEAARGPDHIDAATIWHNLGGVEHARGRFVDGEIYARRSVQIRETVLGPDHVAVAADLAALAALVQEQRRFGEAEKLHRRAIAIFEAAFGPIHYELGVNYNNLAALHAARGKLREAENLYQRALDIKQRLLGDNHPDVAMTLHNLAMLYTQQADDDRARDLWVQIQKDLLGQARFLFDQPLLDRHRLATIPAGMAQEHPRHASPPIGTGIRKQHNRAPPQIVAPTSRLAWRNRPILSKMPHLLLQPPQCQAQISTSVARASSPTSSIADDPRCIGNETKFGDSRNPSFSRQTTYRLIAAVSHSRSGVT